MNAVKKFAYPFAVLLGFLYGAAGPLWTPLPAVMEVEQFLRGNLLVTSTIAVLVAFASAAVVYFAIHTSRDQPLLIRVILKLGVIMLLAAASGQATSLLVIGVGFLERSCAYAFFAIGALAYLCGAAAGLVAGCSRPEYIR